MPIMHITPVASTRINPYLNIPPPPPIIQTKVSDSEIENDWSGIYTSAEIAKLKNFINKNKFQQFISNEIPTTMFNDLKIMVNDKMPYYETICKTMYIVSEITKKHKLLDYTICVKGGKAAQMLIAKMNLSFVPIYRSNDVDILLIPKNGIYDREMLHNRALKIAKLVKYLIENDHPTSLFEPPTNSNIIKLSYMFNTNAFEAFMDIDFGETPEYSKPYYENLITFNSKKHQLQYNIQSIDLFIKEKLFFKKSYMLTCTDIDKTCNCGAATIITECRGLCSKCNYYKSKFDNVINYLLHGILIRDAAQMHKKMDNANEIYEINKKMKELYIAYDSTVTPQILNI